MYVAVYVFFKFNCFAIFNARTRLLAYSPTGCSLGVVNVSASNILSGKRLEFSRMSMKFVKQCRTLVYSVSIAVVRHIYDLRLREIDPILLPLFAFQDRFS